MTTNLPASSVPLSGAICRGLLVCLFAGAVALPGRETSADMVVPPEVEALVDTDPNEAALRIGATFETLAGSADNARRLVDGLHSGDEITLSFEIDGQVVQRSFFPAAGGQGLGNVFLTLGLAERELAKAGVREPSPAQLEAALNGGVITVGTGETARSVQLPGVLSLRADGQGWGQVARRLDVKPGDVVSSLRRSPRATEVLALRAARPERPERMARPDRPERVDRVERVARVERPLRAERVERPARPERPSRP